MKRRDGAGQDLPAGVVMAFTFSILGFVGCSAAPLLLTFDVLNSNTRETFARDVLETVVGLALLPAFGAILALFAWLTVLERQYLGRSLATVALVLSALSALGITGYVLQAYDLRDELDQQRSDLQRELDAFDDSLDDLSGDFDFDDETPVDEVPSADACTSDVQEELFFEAVPMDYSVTWLACAGGFAWAEIVGDPAVVGPESYYTAILTTNPPQLLGSGAELCPLDFGMSEDVANAIAPPEPANPLAYCGD